MNVDAIAEKVVGKVIYDEVLMELLVAAEDIAGALLVANAMRKQMPVTIQEAQRLINALFAFEHLPENEAKGMFNTIYARLREESYAKVERVKAGGNKLL